MNEPPGARMRVGSEVSALLGRMPSAVDDLTDPAPATTFAHLDATTVLSRGLAAKGIYPAVDPLDSTSTMLHLESLARNIMKLRNK
ncbi:hypothetical protein HID58_090040 [Brassica napus]|uniref:H(+)-transporting two-sector ATPase n=1 Tax=Brassica napus TaxID=3708 RepID=A0ABQ7XGM0_BRANA|nr:hypothetical protein HID58_090040 [Brassica napus]